MEYRKLGLSGIELSVIGFGCAHTDILMVSDDHDLQIKTVQLALGEGINYFDTAAAYGDGTSEINLGRSLRELGATPVIGTKVVLQSEDLVDVKSAILRNFEAGLVRLGMDVVAMLTIHNRVFLNPDRNAKFAVGAQLSLDEFLGPQGIAAAIDELKREKLIKGVGFTTLGGDREAQDVLIASGVFDFVNASINMLNPSGIIKVPPGGSVQNYQLVATQAAAAGLGVLAIQVLAKGDLTGTGAKVVNTTLIEAARKIDEDIARVAIRYVLSKPTVASAVIGFSNTEHVITAVEAMNNGGLELAQTKSLEVLAINAVSATQ